MDLKLILFLIGVMYATIVGSITTVTENQSIPVIPQYGCYRVLADANGGDRTVRIESDAYAENGAKLINRKYNFGDGFVAIVQTTNPSGPVEHTYSKEGVYEVSVTMYFTVDGRIDEVTNSGCQTTVVVD